MPIARARTALSFRRSSSRARVLEVLSRHRAMFPQELAEACNMDASRLRKVIFGYPPNYRIERSLATLGLVERTNTVDGDVYVITKAGLREAALLRAQGGEARGRRA